MKVLENGKYKELTDEEMNLNHKTELLSYKDRVIARIRERYSIDDEIAILRQKDTKFEEWVEYNSFVENVKIEEKVKEQIF